MEASPQNMEIPMTNYFTNTNGDHVILMPDQAASPPLKQTPPAEPTLTRTKTIRSLNFSKPKARFSEVVTAYYQHHKTIPQTPINQHHQPLSPQDDTDEEEDDWFDEEELDNDDEQDPLKKYRKRSKINKRALIEWSLFVLITTCLITSLLVKTKENNVILGLEIWKWCLMVLVVFSGRLVSGWVVGFLVFLIERNFMLREKVLYFVYGLRKSFQNCAWLGLVLVAWVIMFPNNSHKNNKIMKKAFRGLVAILIGATIWLLKIVFVKVLASSFHVATFFDRMKESVFHHYVLDTLSGPPLEPEEVAALNNNNNDIERLRSGSRAGVENNNNLPQTPRLSSLKSKRWGARRIDMEKLKKLSLEKRPTAWSLKRLVNYVRFSGLSTISTTVDDFAKAESEINSEWEARTCAKRIFRNVAKPGAKYIEEEDLLRFLKSEEVYTIFPLFEGALETGRITKNSFKNWVVHAYIERKALAHSLNDTKTAVQQLHKLASAVVFVIIIVESLLVMGLATTKVIFVVTSQLLLVGFMFQNTCKTIFESIIFVFVMHPFDVGDRCVVDGVQMIVEEMNILSTVFLKFDMEKIYYPNSVLLTKPISNFRRSPEMSDTIEFSIDASTSFDDINALKKAIQTYIESKPNHWVPKHSVLVKEIEDVNKMKMGLYVQHTMNHQNFGEKSTRRSELLLELKRIFEKLDIKYHLLPQEIILTHMS